MKLRRLQLQGFKSFADRTELVFHDGITAVVGPNGCGKSNISDAIRWVLGEQRASAIRGSKMEEAIFQGTTERRPVNRAEVALTFSNADKTLPVPYDEIEIRRIIYREGGSEYEINRTPCRLKDIVDLCRDTGLGAIAYAVIEQRMVDGILSDRTDDRRQVFEEAAGIGRYKDRRRAAERRLEATRADLERLQDLIGEVESKVRSLARQRRQAQRYQELRDRRFVLEVTLAESECEALQAERDEIAARLARLAEDEPSARATLARLETELEQHRVVAAERMRARSTVASRLELVSRKIAEHDRELAIVEERKTHAERRLAQIDVERRDLLGLIGTLTREIATLTDTLESERTQLEQLADTLEAVQERQLSLRQRVAAARTEAETATRTESELGRRAAELERVVTRSAAQEAESLAQLERLQAEEESIRADLSSHQAQGDLFAGVLRDLAAARETRKAEYEAAVEQLAKLRLEEAEARRAAIEAEDRRDRLAARLAALEALEREYHGLAPRTAAALRARDRLDGILGALPEFLRIPPERAAAVENALGSILQILVVRDPSVAASVERWLAGEAPGEGMLALLPRDVLPDLERLLEEIVILGDPPAEAVLIGRRERFTALQAEAAEAEAELAAKQEARESIERAAEEADALLRERESALQSVELELTRAEAEVASYAGQSGRLERTLEELDRRRISLLEQLEQARRDAEAAREARAALDAQIEALHEAREASRAALARLEAEWEEARDEESELRVVHARAEAAVADLNRRLNEARNRAEGARRRVEQLGREEEDHRRTLTQLAEIRNTSGGRVEELFHERDELEAQLRTLDEELESTSAAIASLETELRNIRRGTEQRVEERHRLELRQGELDARLRSVRERLEVEWGRPYAQLVEGVERFPGDANALRAELSTVSADLERLGPINMLAIEEYEEESKRLAFLTEQRNDLEQACEDLQDAIRQINRHARELFTETFEQVRRNFHRTFGTLFEGGVCDLALSNPDDPLESDIEVSASPRGKRTQRIHLLSGGERALTALSLLFAIYLVKPSPFCVLDEVDAPLDESNVGRFVRMIQEFKKETQFIVITHNPRTIEAADWVYGVTMAEPGVSTMVGVQLDPALTGASA